MSPQSAMNGGVGCLDNSYEKRKIVSALKKNISGKDFCELPEGTQKCTFSTKDMGIMGIGVLHDESQLEQTRQKTCLMSFESECDSYSNYSNTNQTCKFHNWKIFENCQCHVPNPFKINNTMSCLCSIDSYTKYEKQNKTATCECSRLFRKTCTFTDSNTISPKATCKFENCIFPFNTISYQKEIPSLEQKCNGVLVTPPPTTKAPTTTKLPTTTTEQPITTTITTIPTTNATTEVDNTTVQTTVKAKTLSSTPTTMNNNYTNSLNDTQTLFYNQTPTVFENVSNIHGLVGSGGSKSSTTVTVGLSVSLLMLLLFLLGGISYIRNNKRTLKYRLQRTPKRKSKKTPQIQYSSLENEVQIMKDS